MQIARVSVRDAVRALAAAVAVGAALGACGGSSTVHHPATPPPADTTPTTTTTTTTAPPATSTVTTSSTATTTSTPAPPPTPACTASELTPSYLGSNGAPGQIVLSFALRNDGGAACHTYGFPGVQFLGHGNAALPTRTTHTTQDVLGSTPEVEIVVAPGQDASFRMIAATVGRGGTNAGCATAGALQIIAPDDTATMHVAITNGVVECSVTSVSPLQPGHGAVPGV